MKKLLIILIALVAMSCTIEVVEDDKTSELNEFNNPPTRIVFKDVMYGFVMAKDSVFLIPLPEIASIEFDQTGSFFKAITDNDTFVYKCDPIYDITTAKLMKQ